MYGTFLIMFERIWTFPTVSIMIFCVLLSPASAAEDTEDVDYVLQIDWSDSFNYHSPDLVSHCYHIRSSKSTRWNKKRMYKPTYYGLPGDIVFSGGPGLLEWTYIYPYGLKYAVRYNGQMYTNNTNAVDYITGYLPTPKRSITNNNIDEVYRTDVDYTVRNNDITLSTKITCDWHHTSSRSGNKDYYRDCVNILAEIENVELWPTVETSDIDITITNHSGKYTTISFNIPDNTTSIEINLNSNNHTATYKKYYYYYIKNDSGFYDMFNGDTVLRSGMVPYGSGCYLLPYQPDYQVSAHVSTPFEKLNLIMSVTRTDIEETEPEETDIQLLGSLLSVLLGFMIIYKGLS